MKTKLIEKFHKNNSIWERYSVLTPSGIRHGEYASFYANGSPSVKCSYKDGRLDGSYKQYYENGKVLCESTFVNGRLIGLLTNFFPSGNIEILEYYVDGICVKKEDLTDENSYVNNIRIHLFYNETEEYDERINSFIGLFIDESEIIDDRLTKKIIRPQGELAPLN
jgi:antitoxin component YwqK of YwqJK toxin-antitoxin module